jgi:hypothetical protein
MVTHHRPLPSCEGSCRFSVEREGGCKISPISLGALSPVVDDTKDARDNSTGGGPDTGGPKRGDAYIAFLLFDTKGRAQSSKIPLLGV